MRYAPPAFLTAETERPPPPPDDRPAGTAAAPPADLPVPQLRPPQAFFSARAVRRAAVPRPGAPTEEPRTPRALLSPADFWGGRGRAGGTMATGAGCGGDGRRRRLPALRGVLPLQCGQNLRAGENFLPGGGVYVHHLRGQRTARRLPGSAGFLRSEGDCWGGGVQTHHQPEVVAAYAHLQPRRLPGGFQQTGKVARFWGVRLQQLGHIATNMFDGHNAPFSRPAAAEGATPRPRTLRL